MKTSQKIRMEEFGDAFIRNNEDKSLCESYYRHLNTFMAGASCAFIDMQLSEEAISKHNADLLKTIERGEEEIERLKEDLTVERNVRISFERAHGKLKAENEKLTNIITEALHNNH